MNVIASIEGLTIGQIPKNTIVNADCLDAMQLIPDKSIDCIICDLPYGITACKWDVVIPFEPLWEQSCEPFLVGFTGLGIASTAKPPILYH